MSGCWLRGVTEWNCHQLKYARGVLRGGGALRVEISEEVLVLVRRSSNVDLYQDDLVSIITCTADVGNVPSYLGRLLLLAAPWALLFPL